MPSILSRAQFFKNAAHSRLENAMGISSMHADSYFRANFPEPEKIDFRLLSLPYASKERHVDAIWFPLYHFAKLAIHSAQLFGGLLLLIEAWSLKDEEVSELMSQGMNEQALTMGFDARNLLISVASLISRSIATLMYGYTPTLVASSIQQEMENNGWNKGFSQITGNILGNVVGWSQDVGIDAVISEHTFRF